MLDAFKIADTSALAVRGVTDLIPVPGLIKRTCHVTASCETPAPHHGCGHLDGREGRNARARITSPARGSIDGAEHLDDIVRCTDFTLSKDPGPESFHSVAHEPTSSSVVSSTIRSGTVRVTSSRGFHHNARPRSRRHRRPSRR